MVLPEITWNYGSYCYGNYVGNAPGAQFTKQAYKNFYIKFLVKQSYNVF